MQATQDVRQQTAPTQDALTELCELWTALAPSHELSAENRAQLYRYVIRYDIEAVNLAMATAIDFYIYGQQETAEVALKKMGGICYNQKLEKDDPEQALLYRIYYILRKRLQIPALDKIYEEPGDRNCDQIMDYLDLAVRREICLKSLLRTIRFVKTIKEFEAIVIEHVRDAEKKRSEPDLIVQVNVKVS